MAESVDQHRDQPGLPGLMLRANAYAIAVPEIPLVGRHLPIGVEVAFAQHQIELLLGEIRPMRGSHSERRGLSVRILIV